MNIGEAAKGAGVSTKMIRNYEQIGLLPVAERSDSGYRLYGLRDVSVLRFIRQSRKLGFSMDQIAELIGMWGDDARSSREVKAVAQRHLADLEEKMREIAEMKDALQHLVTACKGDDHTSCAILDNLAVNSPTTPQYSVKVNKTTRTTGDRADSASKKKDSEPGSRIDLMAWMRGAANAHAR
ncbi:MAG: Cu(I)-responsive transcriptional regulator [Rhodoferax sp.]|nr:Cu(I)-responsive transcriptional regulator [Rhodoferax sp.]